MICPHGPGMKKRPWGNRMNVQLLLLCIVHNRAKWRQHCDMVMVTPEAYSRVFFPQNYSNSLDTYMRICFLVFPPNDLAV